MKNNTRKAINNNAMNIVTWVIDQMGSVKRVEVIGSIPCKLEKVGVMNSQCNGNHLSEKHK